MKRWMLVAEPLDFENPVHCVVAIDWNKANAYAPENRFWWRSSAVQAGAALVAATQWRGLRFRVMRVHRD